MGKGSGNRKGTGEGLKRKAIREWKGVGSGMGKAKGKGNRDEEIWLGPRLTLGNGPVREIHNWTRG